MNIMAWRQYFFIIGNRQYFFPTPPNRLRLAIDECLGHLNEILQNSSKFWLQLT